MPLICPLSLVLRPPPPPPSLHLPPPSIVLARENFIRLGLSQPSSVVELCAGDTSSQKMNETITGLSRGGGKVVMGLQR